MSDTTFHLRTWPPSWNSSSASSIRAVCRVYARWATSLPRACYLSGTLDGPTCQYANTLPATSQFVDRGPGGPPLAEAIVPEPCFWTPEMPHLYRARLQLRANGKVLRRPSGCSAFDHWEPRRVRLRLDGKTLGASRRDRRGAKRVGELATWRDTDTDAGRELRAMRSAKRPAALGVLLVAELARLSLARVRRLRRWPAVGMVIPAGRMCGRLEGHSRITCCWRSDLRRAEQHTVALGRCGDLRNGRGAGRVRAQDGAACPSLPSGGRTATEACGRACGLRSLAGGAGTRGLARRLYCVK